MQVEVMQTWNTSVGSGFGLTATMTVTDGDTVYWSSDPQFSDVANAEGHISVGDPAVNFDDKPYYLLSDPNGATGGATVDLETAGGQPIMNGAETPATTLGNIIGKVGVYDPAGNHIGWQPVYDNIT